MSRSRRRFLAQAGSYLILPVASSLGAEVSANSPWRTDFRQARRVSVAESRPLLVFVTMDGCPYCQKMLRTTYEKAGVAAEAAETFVLAVVNGSQQEGLAKQLGVRVYPTTYVIDSNSVLVDRIEGFVPPTQLRRRLAITSRRLAKGSAGKSRR